MNLEKYLQKNGISSAEFSRQLDYLPSTVHKWVQGIRLPKYEARVKVELHTNGEVHRWLDWKMINPEHLTDQKRILREALTRVEYPDEEALPLSLEGEDGEVVDPSFILPSNIQVNLRDLETFEQDLVRHYQHASSMLFNDPGDRTAMACVSEFFKLIRDSQLARWKMGSKEQMDTHLQILADPDFMVLFPIRCTNCGEQFLPVKCPKCSHVNDIPREFKALPEHIEEEEGGEE